MDIMRNQWTIKRCIIYYILFYIIFYLGVLFSTPNLGSGRSLYGAQTISAELKFAPYLVRPSCELNEPLLRIYFAHMFFGMRGVVNVYTYFLP